MKRFVFLFVCLFVGIGSVSADPISFDFFQDGYDEGATVTGMFSGDDLDNNGQLSTFNGEIDSFMMSFSGNGLVSAIMIGFGDLFGLVYDLDGGPLGDGQVGDIEGIGAENMTMTYSYYAGPGPFQLCGIGVDCASVSDSIGESFSAEYVLVSPKQAVPEPSALALLGLGLAGLAAIGFSRKKKKTV